MKFPKNNYDLTKIFKNGTIPKISEFNGEYFVDMLTIVPSLRKFSHRKVFYTETEKVFGYNLLFNNMKWGHFFLEEGICEKVGSLEVVVINYNKPENSFITNRIRDHVRFIENGLYLGRFNYLFRDKLHFLGYFSLSKYPLKEK
ncbi:MAG: hypothetical protein ACE5WD_08845 [Candidatus Aminicenantia bacterium]